MFILRCPSDPVSKKLLYQYFRRPTIEEVREDDLQVLVAGQGVRQICCTCAGQTEDR